MRRPYEDPGHHFQRSVGRAADCYLHGLDRAGLQPNKKLTQAMAERAALAARADYETHSYQTFEGNVHSILNDYHQRDRQIKREGARLAWRTCPLIALIFGALSWSAFHQGDAGMGLLYAVGALVFLAMLILACRRR